MDVRDVGARIRARRRVLSRGPVTIAAVQDPAAPSEQELDELYDNPLERLQLLGEDDAAIAAFLDEIDVRGPRDREMLLEPDEDASVVVLELLGTRQRRRPRELAQHLPVAWPPDVDLVEERGDRLVVSAE